MDAGGYSKRRPPGGFSGRCLMDTLNIIIGNDGRDTLPEASPQARYNLTKAEPVYKVKALTTPPY